MSNCNIYRVRLLLYADLRRGETPQPTRLCRLCLKKKKELTPL